MHHTQQDIERTYALFGGLARVSTRYLYRTKRLKLDKHTPVLAAGQAVPLAKLQVLPVVRLQRMATAAGTLVSITYRYSKEVYKCLKENQVPRWHPEQQCFAIAPGGPPMLALLAELRGLGQLG